jgi:hypothetical protein
VRQIVRDPSTWVETWLGEALVELQLVAGPDKGVGAFAVVLSYTAEHAASLSAGNRPRRDPQPARDWMRIA